MRITAAIGLFAAALAQASPPSIEDFQRQPAFSKPALSPDGRHVAAIMAMPGNLTALVVVPTDKISDARRIQSFGDAHIASVQWLNDKRLVFTARPQDEPDSKNMAPGLWSIESDGKNLKQLVDVRGYGRGLRAPLASRMLEAFWTLKAIPRDGSDEVVMADRERRLLLNVVTGGTRTLTDGIPGKNFDWVLGSKSQPVFAFQDLGKGRWQVVRTDEAGNVTPWSASAQALAPPDRVPLWVDGQGQLYLARRDGGPAANAALHRAGTLDPDAPTTPVLASSVYDIDASPVLDRDSGATVGIHYETNVPRTHWLAPELAAAQAEVDELLPGVVNTLQCQRCQAVTMLLVASRSDRRPPRYYLYDRASKSLTGLSGERPWMPQGSAVQATTIAARDGLPIAVQITRPAGHSAPAPTVMLIHSGPSIRGNHWTWSAEQQFYASRGYLVLETDFRGSRGYGHRHERAGFKQWGRAMQDDLDDTLAWAVKEGLTDPSRICMVGAGYGGYAALMGLVRSEKSGKLACAVATFAPTDLARLNSRHWSHLSADVLANESHEMIGDPASDATLLVANSPLAQADRIHAPLLLAYGEVDRRVPLVHGTELRDRLVALGRPAQWIAYENAGHGPWRADQREDLMRRIEAFLAQHLAAKN